MTPPRRRGTSNARPTKREKYFRLGRPFSTRRVQEKKERERNPISGTLAESGPEEQKGGHIESRFSREVKETDEKGKMAAAKVAL